MSIRNLPNLVDAKFNPPFLTNGMGTQENIKANVCSNGNPPMRQRMILMILLKLMKAAYL
jgi:hypothetical protein